MAVARAINARFILIEVKAMCAAAALLWWIKL